jgi:DNA-binding FadR family transcriptional regulator
MLQHLEPGDIIVSGLTVGKENDDGGIVAGGIIHEGAAAQLAARNATESDIAALRELINQMEADVPAYVNGERTLSYMLQQDDLFHLQCAAASHNEFYIQFINIMHTIGTDMGLYENTYGRTPEKYYGSLDFHKRLVEAIASGHELQAQNIMSHHIESIRFNTEE